MVGRLIPCAPQVGFDSLNSAHGVTRPTAQEFMGSLHGFLRGIGTINLKTCKLLICRLGVLRFMESDNLHTYQQRGDEPERRALLGRLGERPPMPSKARRSERRFREREKRSNGRGRSSCQKVFASTLLFQSLTDGSKQLPSHNCIAWRDPVSAKHRFGSEPEKLQRETEATAAEFKSHVRLSRAKPRMNTNAHKFGNK